MPRTDPPLSCYTETVLFATILSMNWREFSRDHKKILVSFACALAIIVVGFVVHERDALRQFSAERFARDGQPQSVALIMGTSSDMTTRDSDMDGLPDWEERMYGSDPFISDTDKDGTSDGQEVRIGRDASKPNTAKKGKEPNDKLKVAQDPHFATSSTDVLGLKKEFFAKQLAVYGQGVRNTTMRDLLGGFDAKKFTVKNQLVDLDVASGNDVASLHAYGNAFGALITKYTERTHRTEGEILEEGMKAKSDVVLRELQLPSITYKNFSRDLKDMKVPSALASAHLLIVNGYEQMSKGLLGMQVMHTNPVDGAAGYQAYNKGRTDVTNGYAGVMYYLKSKEVVFMTDEPGYPLYAMILRASIPSSKPPTTIKK